MPEKHQKSRLNLGLDGLSKSKNSTFVHTVNCLICLTLMSFRRAV